MTDGDELKRCSRQGFVIHRMFDICSSKATSLFEKWPVPTLNVCYFVAQSMLGCNCLVMVI